MGRYINDKDFLERVGPEHMQRFVRDPTEVSVDYASGIPFARRVDGEGDGLIRIKLNGKTRVVICAMSGEGKTLIAEGGISRALLEGWKAFHGSDVNNDFNSIDKYGGIQQAELDVLGGLLPGEQPQEFERMVWVPEFMFSKYSVKEISWGTRFTLGWRDLSEQDVRFLLNAGSWRSGAQQDVLDEILRNIDLDTTNLKEIRELCNELRDGDIFRSDSVDKVYDKLENLEKDNLVSNRRRKLDGMFTDFKPGMAMSLCLYHANLCSKEHVRFVSGVIHRNLVQAILDGRLSGKLILFEDEFHEIAPDGEPSTVKDEYQTVLNKTGRRAEVATIIATQQPSQLPYPESKDDKDFFSPGTHYFIGRGLSWKDVKAVLNGTGLFHRGNSDKWKRLYSRLQEFQFIFIDNNRHQGPEDAVIVTALAPLWHHGGYSERSTETAN